MKKKTVSKLKRTIILAAMALGSAALLKLCTSAMIITFGIRSATTLSYLIPGIFGAGCVLSFAGMIGTAYKEYRADRELEARKLEALDMDRDIEERYKKDAGNPENTRMRLEQIKAESPGVAALMDRCIQQLDRMDELQRRQQLLLSSNDAAYLKDTVNTLEQVEHELCLNYRGLVNQCIVSGAAADESKLDMVKVNAALNKNKDLLDQSKELLKVSADWIDKYNEQEDPDRSLLDSWIRTIRNTINGGELN